MKNKYMYMSSIVSLHEQKKIQYINTSIGLCLKQKEKKGAFGV